MLDYAAVRVLSEWTEVLGLGMISVDAQGIIQLMNKRAAFLLEVDVREAVGKPLEHLPEGQAMGEILSGAAQNTMERHLNLKERNVRLLVTPLKAEEEAQGKLMLLQEETELAAILKKLGEAEKLNYYLERTLDSAFGEIVTIDSDFRIVFMGERTAYRIGVNKAKARGLSLDEITPYCLVKNIVQNGKARIGEIWKNPDHSIIIPLCNSEGVFEGVIWKNMFRDLEEARDFIRRHGYEKNGKKPKGHNNTRKVRAAKYTFDDIIGSSPVMKKTKEVARQVAQTDSTVLLLGESGTGKELFAHAIHATSSRSKGPLITVNCAAIPETLLEAELFGYEEGAFSGAKKGGKPGKFELAHRGTIFLDEIGDISLNMQTKLLRALQEREIERVGGVESLEVDVRVITATNQDLKEKVKKKTFREDLYYRLDVISLVMPPLRERMEDLPVLLNCLLDRLSYRTGINVIGVSDDVMKVFRNYSWPGNIRELENVVEGAICLSKGGFITAEQLPLHFKQRALELENIFIPSGRLGSTLESIEKKAIEKALESANGSKKQAALMLGIPRSTFYYKLKQYGLERG